LLGDGDASERTPWTRRLVTRSPAKGEANRPASSDFARLVENFAISGVTQAASARTGKGQGLLDVLATPASTADVEGRKRGVSGTSIRADVFERPPGRSEASPIEGDRVTPFFMSIKSHFPKALEHRRRTTQVRSSRASRS
jgi:hypothetical protein